MGKSLTCLRDLVSIRGPLNFFPSESSFFARIYIWECSTTVVRLSLNIGCFSSTEHLKTVLYNCRKVFLHAKMLQFPIILYIQLKYSTESQWNNDFFCSVVDIDYTVTLQYGNNKKNPFLFLPNPMGKEGNDFKKGSPFIFSFRAMQSS